MTRPAWWDGGLVAVVHDVRSMHNVGAIFRTADGAGFDGVILSGISGAPPDPRIAKVALGAEESLPWVRADTVDQLVALLDGALVVVLEQHADAVPVGELTVSVDLPVALVVAGELDGAPDALIARADTICEIPMFGRKESLNVSVAFGIAAYRLAEGRHAGERGLLRVRGRQPVREGVLTRGVTQGQTPTRAPSPQPPAGS